MDKHPDFAQDCAKKIKVININEASVKLHKAPNKEYLINNLQKTFNERSFEIFKNELTAIANGATSFESESELLTLKGEIIHVIIKLFAVDSELKGLSKVIVSIYDMTERVKNTKKTEQINRQLIDERNIFTKGNVVVFKWLNGNNWPVEYVSQNVSNVFGYSVDDFISGKIAFGDIVHPEDVQQVADEVNQAQDNNVDDFTHKPYRIKHKNGKDVWLYDFTTIIRNDKGVVTHYLGYVKDITKSKLLEIEKDDLFEVVNKQRNEFEALSEEYKTIIDELELKNIELQASKERLSVSTDTGKIGIWEWDLESRLSQWNDIMFEIHGMEKKSPMHYENWLDLIHPEDRNQASNVIDQLISEGGSIRTALKVLRINGEERNVLASAKTIKDNKGKTNRIIGAFVDITKLKVAENELTNQKKLFETMFNSISDAIVITDTNRKITIQNKGAQSMFKYTLRNELAITYKSLLVLLNFYGVKKTSSSPAIISFFAL